MTVYALRRLAAAATFLYEDDRGRYWYSTQPTVTKIAEDRAELLKRNSDAVAQEIEKRVRLDLRNTGDFRRVHPLPQSSQDVSDDPEARLVVLGVDQPYSKDPNSAAVVAAKAILQSRGNSPRLLRNALVFLALDQTRLQDLDEAVRRYLAWDSIVDEAESLELAPSQLKQAQTQRDSANSAVTARLPEAYQWLIVPVQATPQSEIDWQAFRLAGSDPLAVRAAKKLRKDELLITSMAGTRLRMELDRVPLWRTEHVTVKQLAEDFGRYLYLPRLSDAQVLLEAINDGVTLLTWEKETFAYADSYDEAAGRYRGLRHSHRLLLTDVNVGMIVKPEAARRQIDAEAAVAQGTGGGASSSSGQPTSGNGGTSASQPGVSGPLPFPQPSAQPKRFHGTVNLDPTRVGRDAGRIADEVISHLEGLVGSKVKVTMETKPRYPAALLITWCARSQKTAEL